MDNNTQQKDNGILQTAIKGIALILGLFILGNVIGSLTNIKRINTFETVNNQTTTESTTIPQIITTAQPTTESTTQITTTEPTTAITTTVVTTTEDTTPDTKEEIVALFNESANKVKKTAKKVTRNYENIRHDESLSEYPLVLKLTYGSLINSWIVDHDTPIEYVQSQGDEPDLIKANFPVKDKDWSSKLTAKDVDNAIITEENGNYHIILELSYCKDPAEDTGVCSVMEEVNLQKVQELVEIVKTCETEYYECKIECLIEKNSRNMIYAKYTQPMILNLTTQRLTQLKATFAISTESEFEIEY